MSLLLNPVKQLPTRHAAQYIHNMARVGIHMTHMNDYNYATSTVKTSTVSYDVQWNNNTK